MRKWEIFSEEKLKEIYNQSVNKTDFIEKLGYKRGSHVTDNFNQIKKKYSWVKDFPKVKPWNRENLIGQKYGYLQVISDTGSSQNGHSIWLCKCDCGKLIKVSADRLKSKNTQSCGCIQKEFASKLGKQAIDDLSGQIFNYLEVLYDSGERQGGNVKWICRCLNCGKITRPIVASSIKRGITKSCGCLQESYYEKIITNILEELNISFKKQFIFPDLKGDFDNLRFDFAVFKNNNLKYLIECQGEQHYNPIKHFGGENTFLRQQRYGKKKREYCKQHNIKLIEIPYWDFDKINEEYILKLIA